MIAFFTSLCLCACQKPCVTTHEASYFETPMTYTAVVDSLPLRSNNGEAAGDLHYTAYRKEGANAAERPITFVFNGGPGSSSVWLHMGAFGPKRAVNWEEGQTSSPPYRWIDNPDSMLDVTDLVFIDPMGSGFSRTADESVARGCYSAEGDVQAIGDFISDFVTREGRWLSPKYLAGESYGAHRACGLSLYLQERRGLYMNGLILISGAIDYQSFIFHPDNPLPYTLFLPSFAAAAWHHGLLDQNQSLEEIVRQARSFALDTYAPALWKFGQVPPSLYTEISHWTGLPLSTVRQHDGLVDDFTYFTHLLSDTKRLIGRFDSRQTGAAHFSRACYLDPSSLQLSGIFTATLHDYLRNELGCDRDWPRYEVFSEEAYQAWQFNSFGYPSAMDHLRLALIGNPSMKIFNACGYFDLATPFATAEYSFQRLHTGDPEHISFGYYEGGHMFYTNPNALKKFKQDLIRFYNE